MQPALLGWRHDHPYLRHRGGLHRRGAPLASHGAAARPRLVATGPSHQRHSTGHHAARRPDVESLARAPLVISSRRASRAVELGFHRLCFLHLCLLLVASVSPRIAIPLADLASDPSFRAPVGNPDELLQASGRDLDQLAPQQFDRVSLCSAAAWKRPATTRFSSRWANSFIIGTSRHRAGSVIFSSDRNPIACTINSGITPIILATCRSGISSSALSRIRPSSGGGAATKIGAKIGSMTWSRSAMSTRRCGRNPTAAFFAELYWLLQTVGLHRG